ncbi:hypothetical protein Emed_007663 [Eimeria media]
MEDVLFLREAPPVQEEAHVQQEDPPGTSEAASAEASGAYSSEAYMGPDLFKITRPFVRHRALWVALAALASSIMLVLIIEAQLHLVEKAPPIKPQELPEGEPKGPTEELLPPKKPRPAEVLKLTPEKPTEVREEELLPPKVSCSTFALITVEVEWLPAFAGA